MFRYFSIVLLLYKIFNCEVDGNTRSVDDRVQVPTSSAGYRSQLCQQFSLDHAISAYNSDEYQAEIRSLARYERDFMQNVDVTDNMMLENVNILDEDGSKMSKFDGLVSPTVKLLDTLGGMKEG